MSRPRTSDLDLPRNVYERRGSYFFVKGGRWINLGRDKKQAIAAGSGFLMPPTMEQKPLLAYTFRVLARARQNAKGRRGIPFALTKQDARDLLEQAGWRCAVTRTPFSLETVGAHTDKPFAPSIDRINSALGYERSNCRVVCVATNFAMNRWGEGVLRTLLHHLNQA